MIIASGAEAVIKLQGKVIIKSRKKKQYRVTELDEYLRKERTKMEAKITSDARKCGIPTPIIYDVEDYEIKMEYIKGEPLKKILNLELSRKVGELVGYLHNCGIIHGDLTTSNLILSSTNNKIYFIDFGLSYYDKTVEARGVDVHVLFQTFESTHREPDKLRNAFSIGYKKTFKSAEEVLKRVIEIEKRGRYM
ncbi:MAG: Kae1-associated kinase Bud32 [Methanosarcinales archaeon]